MTPQQLLEIQMQGKSWEGISTNMAREMRGRMAQLIKEHGAEEAERIVREKRMKHTTDQYTGQVTESKCNQCGAICNFEQEECPFCAKVFVKE